MPTFDPDGPMRQHAAAFHAIPGTGVPLVDPVPPGRSHAMRRRVLVFFGVFLLAAAASMAYVFLRPPIYLANARVQVTPSTMGASVASSAARDSSQDFMVEMQVLSSRPLLEKVAQRLAGAIALPTSPDEALLTLQQMLSFTPVPGTNVVNIEARGPDAQAAARLVNTVVEVYRVEQATTGDAGQAQQLTEAREALRLMDERVSTRKRAVEEFRIRSSIMSAERDENRTLSRLKGMGAAAAKNDEREAAAEGRVKALEDAIASGRRAPQSKDNPTVASMENRLSQWREEYRALERQFTQQYLDMDPAARGLRTRIGNLEQQLDGERKRSQENALSEAREELAAARATSQRLQQQADADKGKVESFTRRFAEFKAMEEELKGLEQMRQTARQRMIAMEATLKERKPRTLVVEAAAVPESPWRPLYARDAGIALGGSLALGFLAVWFVEFFDRKEPIAAAAGPTVIMPQPWVQPYPVGPTLGVSPAMPAVAHQPGTGAETAVALLSRPLPRELSQEEVAAMLAAAPPEHLFMLICLLSGLSAEEACALRVRDLDTSTGQLQVSGDGARALPLAGPLAALQVGREPPALDKPLLPSLSGHPLTLDDIASTVTSSAFDAGLDEPHTVTPDSLRHTYLVFLVRQGLRFGDLARVVGRVPSDLLNALAPLAPAGERRPLAQVERVMPAVAALDAPGESA